MRGLLFGLVILLIAGPLQARQAACDRTCLDQIAAEYKDAYLAHDTRRTPFARSVQFTENNVEMALPDGTWDTVTREIGPALTTADPTTGNVSVFTSIMQNDVPGFLAIRLKVRDRKIVEVEHFVSTQRNLSLNKLGDVENFVHDPVFARPIEPGDRMTRAELIAIASGYFSVLEKNDGRLFGLRFSPTARRFANGRIFTEIGKEFGNGFFRFNDRVRDREAFLVDEANGIVVARVVLDHKGHLDRYKLVDGTEMRSPYREPNTLMGFELFKIEKGEITDMETVYVQVPYNMASFWDEKRMGPPEGTVKRSASIGSARR